MVGAILKVALDSLAIASEVEVLLIGQIFSDQPTEWPNEGADTNHEAKAPHKHSCQKLAVVFLGD